MSELVIFGTGGFGEVAYKYFTQDSDNEIVAFTADKDYISDDHLFKLPVVPFEDVAEVYPPDKYDMFIAITYTNLNHLRTQKFEEAKRMGYNLVSYVSSHSSVWNDVTVGENCFIFENQTIQPFVDIGDNVILWSGNHVGHHSSIGDNCFVASHVVISGRVNIGDYSFLGVNSTIIDGIDVADKTIVGAGAMITEDTEENGVYVGESASIKDTDSRNYL